MSANIVKHTILGVLGFGILLLSVPSVYAAEHPNRCGTSVTLQSSLEKGIESVKQKLEQKAWDDALGAIHPLHSALDRYTQHVKGCSACKGYIKKEKISWWQLLKSVEDWVEEQEKEYCDILNNLTAEIVRAKDGPWRTKHLPDKINKWIDKLIHLKEVFVD